MNERTVVAVDGGMIYCSDGSVWLVTSYGYEEKTPIPGTPRAAQTSTVRAAS